MTVEKLEKEAEEKAKDYTENKERQIAYECGFLDGAGPREKRIADLEHEVELWKKASEDNSYKAFQLQEENKSLTNIKNIYIGDLLKAKDLLKWALHSDPEHEEDFEKKWSEAEQFLSEVEK